MSGWRRALDVYVAGRSRVLTADEKRDIPTRDVKSLPAGSSQAVDRAYGVSVPARLDFYRNASTWRDRLPDEESRGNAQL